MGLIKNKKGWLRIVEAIFGIMIMAGVLLAVYSAQTTNVKSSEYVSVLEKGILKDISDSYSLREKVLNNSFLSLNEFVASNLGSSYSFTISICNLSKGICDSCANISGKEVYSEEIVISSSVNTYSPKIFKISAWSKGSGLREQISCDGRLANGVACTEHSNCTSGYCNGAVCASVPVWYYDEDCDEYGNGDTFSSIVRPSAPGCVNTTLEVSTISTLDCNDTNLSIHTGCGIKRWYLDNDNDGFVNASSYQDIDILAGLSGTWLTIPVGTSLASRTDCDDSNYSKNVLIGGVCKSGLSNGAACTTDDVCVSGVCGETIGDVCVSGLNTADCNSDSDCAVGLKCDILTTYTCTDGDLGSPCGSKIDCMGGFFCGGASGGNVCTTGLQDVGCDNNDGCESNICTDNFCE